MGHKWLILFMVSIPTCSDNYTKHSELAKHRGSALGAHDTYSYQSILNSQVHFTVLGLTYYKKKSHNKISK